MFPIIDESGKKTYVYHYDVLEIYDWYKSAEQLGKSIQELKEREAKKRISIQYL